MTVIMCKCIPNLEAVGQFFFGTEKPLGLDSLGVVKLDTGQRSILDPNNSINKRMFNSLWTLQAIFIQQ